MKAILALYDLCDWLQKDPDKKKLSVIYISNRAFDILIQEGMLFLFLDNAVKNILADNGKIFEQIWRNLRHQSAPVSILQ